MVMTQDSNCKTNNKIPVSIKLDPQIIKMQDIFVIGTVLVKRCSVLPPPSPGATLICVRTAKPCFV